MIVAFDFDKTLTDIRMQELCKKLIRERNEVWVVTMRRENEFNKKEMGTILQKVRLSFGSVIFCNDKPKFDLIKMLNADIYIDNISDEFNNISNYTNTIPLLWLSQ